MLNHLIKLGILAVFLYGLIYPFIQPTSEPVPETVTEEAIKPVEPVEVVEQPLHDVTLPDFDKIADVRAKKKQFFDFIKPHVEKENQRILQQRATLEIAQMMLQFGEPLTDNQIAKLTRIFEYYRLNTNNFDETAITNALLHVDIIPKELALMQAANESAWGTSRFARIGLNFFGQWCYKKGCGMVPKRRANEAAHEVAAFKSVQAGVSSYFRNINTHNAYEELRLKRAQLRAAQQPIEATELTAGLLSYSERGSAYVEELNDMIRHNKAYFNEE